MGQFVLDFFGQPPNGVLGQTSLVDHNLKIGHASILKKKTKAICEEAYKFWKVSSVKCIIRSDPKADRIRLRGSI